MKRRVMQMQCGCAFVAIDGVIERRWSCGVQLFDHPPFVEVARVGKVTITISVSSG